ncbi:MAG: phage holin family protein [Sphingobacteriaceae bacterium]|nr:phage holin family protein [Sphingobacteriaceae bacterium]
MKYIIETLLLGLIIYFAHHFISGVVVINFQTAIIATVCIALANMTIGAVLRLVTFPINFFTLGSVSFLISVLMVLLVSYFLPGFKVAFLAAVKLALILSIVKTVFSLLYPKS